MGFLNDKLVANYGQHRIEVRADNDMLRGLLYTLFVDGKEVADARNLLKIPSKRRLEATVELSGKPRTVVVDVTQRILSTAFELRVDDEVVSLTEVE
jgi:hypothetical protein